MSLLPPSPFMNPSVIRPRTEGSAVASKPPPAADATAAPISDDQDVPARMQESKARHSGLARDDEKPGVTTQESRPAHPATASSETEPSMTMEVPSEASAPAPTKNPDADALGTDCIHEIFAGAAKIDDYRFDAEFDEAAFLYAIEEGEEMPLFVRDGLHLQRWA